MFAELLDSPGVHEECELRSGFGFMAYHGGTLEKATAEIARDAAGMAGASLYTVVQTGADPVHVPSTEIDPDASAALSAFLRHVEVVVTVHGYGRDDLLDTVLVGGLNARLGRHLVDHMAPRLPGYEFRVDPGHIPDGLGGRHPANPVNLPRGGGAQLELPPTLRWNHRERGWSDHDGVGRAPQVVGLVAALSDAALGWADADEAVRSGSGRDVRGERRLSR